LLAQRGLSTPAEALGFLDPDHYRPAPPTELPDLAFAAERLYRASTRGEKIVVWGDFDADGQTATTLLVSLLRDLRADATYYIPQRLTESHGIKLPTLDRLLERHIDVLLTCDTGISEHAAIDHARARGVTVLVTDHHDLPEELPAADALVNPQRLPPDHALRHLPGVGVAFKLAQQVLHLAGEDARADDYLDLVALGIVADVAEQRADTRYLLQRGLERLKRTSRLGLQALMAQAQLDTDNLTAEHIGFQIGPRLNALGRLGDANLSVELLTTTNLTRARILAAQLDGLNNQRKLLMDQIYAAAQEQIAKDEALLDYAALVLINPHWHSGVIGPVANRLAEQYQRPVVLLVDGGDGMARGSARSVAGVDITAALKRCGAHLNNVGGHPGAAGLSLPVANLPVFRRALSDAVEAIRDTPVETGTRIDAELTLDQLTLDLAREVERLAPFGEGNPRVTFATRAVTVERSRTFGRKSEHREIVIADEAGRTQTLTWWRGAGLDLPDGRLDVAYAIKSSNYRGEVALNLEWIDYQISAAPAIEIAPTLQIKVIDWRSQPGAQLTAQLPSDWLIWADGSASPPKQAVRRYDLREAETLVIWAAPCGWREVEYAVQRVKPQTLVLCAADSVDDRVEAFLKRLAGLLRHDLTRRGGQVDLARLSAALNQRLITARKGIERLEANGQLRVVEWGHDRVVVEAWHGETRAEAEDVLAELKVLLAETAAWRAHYRRMPLEPFETLARRSRSGREISR
jgi:single-stranded-DNA-specific exonuclease